MARRLMDRNLTLNLLVSVIVFLHRVCHLCLL
uniref:Uncharacterized protein n=1 Tax=virus sp. ctBM815 TaxID=2825806 RepID=A0A8S5RJN8_9VIRU|nr:MAG TPA: hypothetical protein [virus sp. ctBM815]DAG45340.1 MAG TPA: hypothetical protein [Caudoviricetes sp.]